MGMKDFVDKLHIENDNRNGYGMFALIRLVLCSGTDLFGMILSTDIKILDTEDSGKVLPRGEDGFIVITDRKKDLILVGGFNVYPREVEDILFEHPKVAMAAVIGVPDDRSGESVKAFIQVKPGETVTEEEILAYCKKNMAGYKCPRQVAFREELPVSAVGKVLRRVLRDEEIKKGRD